MTITAIAPLAVKSDDLKPVEQIDITTDLTIMLTICVLAAMALIACAVILARPSRSKPQPHAAHVPNKDRARWQRRIDDVLLRHKAGGLTSEQAFTELAAICRDFASANIGQDMSAHTLTDIRLEPRTPSTRGGLDLLRVTIEALYPPEFADRTVNAHASRASVEDAAGWVSTLVERWGR